ncbi:histidine kinase [Sphingobacterium sp. SGG-5]|uniref:ligand-binding sensor domain-containing protein n=1 Tax=Sphingobacterium sp. SGG-5 TaxID=2710881 RepID=UPI0013EC31CF|nr:sensor histidine kinase [Sphingobacterium sp. SGG-5]NGM61530.1 histidine kinase [Sphingobacterium sp. SGG-5]
MYALWAVALKSQPYYFTHYQVEQGLSNNAVLCSLQDSKGFMWFGTKDGLNRFDGYTFKVFQNDPSAGSLLGSNYIRALHESRDGKIWVGTDQGIYIFDPAFEQFRLLHASIVDEILDIREDHTGDIWFISDLVLYQYKTKTDSIVQVSHKINVSAFCFTNNAQEVWLSTTHGQLLQYNRHTEKFTSYPIFEDALPSVDHWIEKIYYTSGNQFILGTRKHGIKLFDLISHSCKSLLSRDNKNEAIFVRDIIHHKDQEYWFATESGIVVYDMQTDIHTFLTREKDDPWSLADNAVYTFCKDQEGAIWVGTYFGGINYYSKTNTFFEKFFPKDIPNAISGYAVREIVADKYGKIWVGTEDGGLNRFDPKTTSFTNFKPSRQAGSIAHSNIHGLLATGDTLWIGTFEHGLDLLDIPTGKVFQHYNADDTRGALGNNFIFNILKTKRGNILLATGRGLYSYNPVTRSFSRSSDVPNYIFYTTLFEDNEGTIWVGTWRDGLFYFNPSTKKKGRLTHDPTNFNSISSNRVNRIFQDSKNQIWIATEGGLCKFNTKSTSFTRFDKHNGLPSNLILSFMEDNAGILWISTSKGLVRLDPESNDMKVFTRANGLLSDQFNYNSSYKDESGNLYFGSVKGLIRFDPRNYRETDYQAPVYITGFQVHNQELRIGTEDSPLRSSIIFTKTIKLKYNQSTFSIDFAALSFTSPTMTEYAYKMEGLDKEWVRLKKNRKVYFTNMAPGKYTFIVNVVDSKGSFKGKETKLYIEISPPFWASTAAYLFYFALVVAIIYYSINSYDRKIKERNRRRLDTIKHQREKTLYQAKIDFFTLIVHEIRTPLTLIKAPLEKVIQMINATPAVKRNLELIERNTERLITLSGQLLDFRKVEANGFSLSFKKVDITDLLSETYSSFRLSAEKKKVQLSLHVPQEHIYADMDSEAFVKIITNLMDNAIKYCHSFVRVYLEYDSLATSAQIKIRVVNDGPLIPKEMREKIFEPFYRMKEGIHKQGTGIGLALSRSMAELLNGSLELQFTDDNLNTFILILPQMQTDNEREK